MLLSQAKTVLREIKPLKSYEQLKEVYNRYEWKTEGCSIEYNKFTAQHQKWDIEKMQVGDKNAAYFSNGKVILWTGKSLGKIKNLSYYESGGFAPTKRVSITFTFKGMTFRGICSYKSMECFTFKRIK